MFRLLQPSNSLLACRKSNSESIGIFKHHFLFAIKSLFGYFYNAGKLLQFFYQPLYGLYFEIKTRISCQSGYRFFWGREKHKSCILPFKLCPTKRRIGFPIKAGAGTFKTNRNIPCGSSLYICHTQKGYTYCHIVRFLSPKTIKRQLYFIQQKLIPAFVNIW
jgi:hypothetical protein